MYDQWSLQNVLGRHNSGRDVPDSVVNEWGANATAWVKQMVTADKGHAAFLSSCEYHCGRWDEIQIDGDTSATAFADWYNMVSLPTRLAMAACFPSPHV